MTITIYRYTGRHSGSVFMAETVTEIETDSVPENEEALASQYGGDFIVIDASGL